MYKVWSRKMTVRERAALGPEADMFIYDEAWPSQRAAIEARVGDYNERCLPEERLCLRAGGCIGSGAQVNWCAPAGAWLCLDCLEHFSGREVGF